MKRNSKKIVEDKPGLIRLNKYIADAGVCSRRKADELIESGKVVVNKKIVTELGTKVKPTDFITVNGDPIKTSAKLIYILLNKPKNCISTTNDEKDRKTVLDIVRTHSRIYPVGRLDRNTTGVLILTNDGEMANRLIHPRYMIERVYKAGLDRPLIERVADRISKGITVDDFSSSPCEIIIDPYDNSLVTIILREGKHHEVKRIFESVGYEVRKLDRKVFAGLSTKGLTRGSYRHLEKSEINHLKNLTKIR